MIRGDLTRSGLGRRADDRWEQGLSEVGNLAQRLPEGLISLAAASGHAPLEAPLHLVNAAGQVVPRKRSVKALVEPVHSPGEALLRATPLCATSR